MIIICGWCKKFLGTKPGNVGEVSHGMCAECKAEQLRLLEEARKPAIKQ